VRNRVRDDAVRRQDFRGDRMIRPPDAKVRGFGL
jgi:hypothetical protein